MQDLKLKPQAFANVEGSQPLAEMKLLSQIPEKLLMAAFQLQSSGRVGRDLLLDESLAGLITPKERKALKRGEFDDTMEIVSHMDEVVDLVYHQQLQESLWADFQKSYPPSVLAVAQELEATGIINHVRILGDAFRDERGRPSISGEKLTAIRSGVIDMDDADYTAFLDKVDHARAHLRAKSHRERFLAKVEAARTALDVYENDKAVVAQRWQEKLQQQLQAQVIAYANFTARTDEAVRAMFVTGPKAKENQALLSKSLNAAVGVGIMLSSVPDSAPMPGTPAAVAAVETAPGAVLTAAALAQEETKAVEGRCADNTRLYFDGKSYNFLIDDPVLCGELLHAIPEKGASVKLNDTMRLKANQDGTFLFSIEDSKTRAECLTNAPSKYKKYLVRSQWAQAATAETGDVCHEAVLKSNVITSRNMNAMIEAWLYSGGKDGRPVPFTYFLSKWFLESRHGNLMGNPTTTANGMNQFVVGTWVDQVLHNGERLGYGDLRERLLTAAANIGLSEDQLNADAKYVRKLSKTQTARELHRQYTADPYHSAVLGSEYSLTGLLRLQRGFKSGDIPHPLGAGHTEVTAKMGYICHLLGFEGCRDFFSAYAKNPDQKVKDVLERGPYKRNAYLFEAHIYQRNEDGSFITGKDGNRKTEKVVKLTLREFTQYLETFGFDDKPMRGLQHYSRLGVDALAIHQQLGKMTFLTENEVKDYDLRQSDSNMLALATQAYPKWMRLVIPAAAERKNDGAQIAVASASNRSPSAI